MEEQLLSSSHIEPELIGMASIRFKAGDVLRLGCDTDIDTLIK